MSSEAASVPGADAAQGALFRRLRRLAGAAGLIAGSGALVGCGGHAAVRHVTAKAQPPAVCRAGAGALVAAAAGAPADSVRAQAGTGNNGEPECRFAGGRVRAVVNVDSSPQPYFRLERTIVEAGQQFGAVRTFAAPVAVRGIGLDAAWLPDLNELITADHTALYTVTVSGRIRPRIRQALAESLARRYVGLR